MAQQLLTAQYEYQKAYGLWFGSIFAAMLGLMWTGIFSSYIGGLSRLVLIIVLLLTGVTALLSAFIVRRAHPLVRGDPLPYMRSWSFWLKFYGVIMVEFLVIFILIRVLQAHQVPNVVFPVIVFVVGAHFYPLARWNGAKLWYFTAAILCGTTIILFLTVRAAETTDILGADSSSVWALVSTGVMVIASLLTSIASIILYQGLVPRR